MGVCMGCGQRGTGFWPPFQGGRDSLALLLTLHAFSRDEGFFLECCCVDHRLRTESAAEAQFVQRVCRSLGVHCTVCTVDVGEEQRRTGDSLETAARSVRYRALRETARTRGMTLIATAHHGDDQAETVLYHMIRAADRRDVEGSAPAGRSDPSFLCVRKEDIRRFLRRFPYTPCHDPTNDEQNCTRNRIRLSLLPAMREYNPRITDSLCRLAEVLREENRWMDGETEKFWNRFGRIEENRACFPLPAFRQCGTALQRRILRWAGRTAVGRRQPSSIMRKPRGSAGFCCGDGQEAEPLRRASWRRFLTEKPGFIREAPAAP